MMEDSGVYVGLGIVIGAALVGALIGLFKLVKGIVWCVDTNSEITRLGQEVKVMRWQLEAIEKKCSSLGGEAEIRLEHDAVLLKTLSGLHDRLILLERKLVFVENPADVPVEEPVEEADEN